MQIVTCQNKVSAKKRRRKIKNQKMCLKWEMRKLVKITKNKTNMVANNIMRFLEIKKVSIIFLKYAKLNIRSLKILNTFE